MKVVNMGNIADAFKFDDLPATGIVIEATPKELKLLPNLAYKDVTISEHVSNAAAKREVAELRECLVRRSSHLNAILQTALELRNGVPSELRKVMDECIVEEDKAIGLGVFSKKGAEDEGK